MVCCGGDGDVQRGECLPGVLAGSVCGGCILECVLQACAWLACRQFVPRVRALSVGPECLPCVLALCKHPSSDPRMHSLHIPNACQECRMLVVIWAPRLG